MVQNKKKYLLKWHVGYNPSFATLWFIALESCIAYQVFACKVVWIVSFSTVNSQVSSSYFVALFRLGGLEMDVFQQTLDIESTEAFRPVEV